jgi:hypothetical protein
MCPPDDYYDDVDDFDDTAYGGISAIRHLFDETQRDEKRFGRRHRRLDKQDWGLHDDFDDYDEDEFDGFQGLDFEHH